MAFNTDQPEYQHLRRIVGERIQGLVFFTGSGISTDAGLPSWTELRQRLHTAAAHKATTFETNEREQREAQLKSIAAITDNWIAIERLEAQLGDATYQAEVRRLLTPTSNGRIPLVYDCIWNMCVNGIVTVNLDRLASQAYSNQRTGALIPINGFDIDRFGYILQQNQPFVVNLHGIVEDSSSWVLTRRRLTALLQKQAYRQFLSSLFTTRTVVFIGVSADDRAVADTLDKLHAMNINMINHHWITSRRDRITERWAQRHGIQVIRYDDNNGHDKPLRDLFHDLTTFVSEDREPQPVVGSVKRAVVSLPEPEQLAVADPEEIRSTLSYYAARIFEDLKDNHELALKQYSDFCRRYERSIYNSWFVSDQSPHNVLFGYQILESIAEGAFGRVLRAKGGSESNGNVAIKLLHQEIRDVKDMLAAFRRGVQSMRILSENQVSGMIPYVEAYELPPCVVMPFVEGANLEEAVKSSLLDRWHDSLRIALEVTRIVRRGHLLPGRVLHRDIRPPNVMLRNFYTSDPSEWEVVVLDFDLSWHLGAMGKSIEIKKGSALGYLAPEQLMLLKGVSTRSTSVDAFGLCMTLYYMLTGTHPEPNESQSDGWERNLVERIARGGRTPWASMPVRAARLIASGTRYAQEERWDMAQIEIELGRLSRALLEPESVESAEMWAEELLHRASPVPHFQIRWDEDRMLAALSLRSGIEISCRGIETQRAVGLSIERLTRGLEERKNLGKYVEPAIERGVATLGRGGFAVTNVNGDYRAPRIDANINVADLAAAPGKTVEAVRQVIGEFQF